MVGGGPRGEEFIKKMHPLEMQLYEVAIMTTLLQEQYCINLLHISGFY